VSLYDEKTGDLITWLKTKAPITALVGVGDNAQIFPRVEPQDITGDALVFDRVTGEQFHNIETESPIRRDVVHFYGYSNKSSVADAIEGVVHDAFAPAGVPIREATFGVSKIHLIRQLGGPTNGMDSPRKADGQWRYWTMGAYEIYVRK